MVRAAQAAPALVRHPGDEGVGFLAAQLKAQRLVIVDSQHQRCGGPAVSARANNLAVDARLELRVGAGTGYRIDRPPLRQRLFRRGELLAVLPDGHGRAYPSLPVDPLAALVDEILRA